jgi:glycosyltransferase involved in cell wall biosynthesis
VRFVCAGFLELDSRFDRFGDRVERVPWQPWQFLPDLQARSDVNLAPLAPTPFNECKSCVKYLEAALVEVPTIASPRSEFVRVIQPGQNGLLADSGDAWREALGHLVEDARIRVEIGRTARADVLERHTTRASLPVIEQSWESLTGIRI